jgi:hypothetical protein
MIDLRHPLAVLANGMPWQEIKASLGQRWARQVKAGMGVKREVVYTDLGNRGVDKENAQIKIEHRGKDKQLTDEERRLLKRRQAIKSIIGHLMTDQRMDRCYLKGSGGMRCMRCCAQLGTTPVGCCG